jgi:hypothetical protein
LGMSSDFSNKISGTTEGQQKCLQYQCYGQRYHFSDIQQPGLAGHFPYMFVDIMYITVPVSVRNWLLTVLAPCNMTQSTH